jgi:hypothetical protein
VATFGYVGTWSWQVTSRRFDTAGPVPLVLDLRSSHELWGSNSDTSINGRLHYPNDVDRPLNETVTDKIRVYRPDYNNRPSNAISFMTPIPSRVSGRLHSDFVCLLFLKPRGNGPFFCSFRSSV